MLKNTLNRIIFAIWGGGRCLSSRNSKLNQYNFIKNSKRGAILIEFAFAVPVLFSLIYYLHDTAKVVQFKYRVDFALHCAASMFQNIPNITGKDYINIAKAASLALYRNKDESGVCQFASACATGTAANVGRINWLVWATDNATTFGSTSSGKIMGAISSGFYKRNIKRDYTYQASAISQDLTLNENEMKIVLELNYRHQHNPNNARTALGTLLYEMKPIETFNSAGYGVLYRSHIIFSPKPGTFTTTPPI